MYLHLGQEVIIKLNDMIGIFDIENTSVSKITRQYLAAAQKKGQVVDISQELPKSFVVCSGKSLKVYLSQISPSTLKKRTGFFEQIYNVL